MTEAAQSAHHDTVRVSLWDIAREFLIIGATGFGGGMAVIALIQHACVRRRKWLTAEEFSHGIAFGQILGPFAVNASTFIGFRLRGLAGAITASLAFLAPSVALVIGLSSLYFRFHQLPALQSALNGIAPVVVALIVGAAYQMSRGRMKKAENILIAISGFVLVLFAQMQIVWILALVAVYGTVRHYASTRRTPDEA
jgi:chromate transporter